MSIIFGTPYLSNNTRPLLSHAGRPPKGLLRLPAGPLSPAKSKGNFSLFYFPRLLTPPRRTPNYGTGSAFSTIDMARSTMPRKPSPPSSACVKVRLPSPGPKQPLTLPLDLDFDKENEILFRLGIIYKQQGKFSESLECFDHILRNPPSPLAHADIWFQIGHVFEQQKNVRTPLTYLRSRLMCPIQYEQAKDAYERVVEASPGHAKVLQQLGWLYHQDGSAFQNQELAITYLTKSLEAGMWTLNIIFVFASLPYRSR